MELGLDVTTKRSEHLKIKNVTLKYIQIYKKHDLYITIHDANTQNCTLVNTYHKEIRLTANVYVTIYVYEKFDAIGYI